MISTDSPLNPSNRTGRQLFYSPNFFYIQNYGAEASKCVTSRGLVGVCMTFDSCVQNQRHKRQLALVDIQQWPPQHRILPYFQPQQEFCTYYDQFARSSYGICCTDIKKITPVQPPQSLQPQEPGQQEDQEKDLEMPMEPNHQKPENTDDSEVLEADLTSYQPEPPKYDNTDNTIDYDPIENLKQAALYNNYNNYIRYPWTQQFVGFSGVQQWPPPVPTHPPSIASWPPPLPTHPPNHHYPTHPALIGGGSHYYPTTTTTRRPFTTTTTRRPMYPNYPTHRPSPTTTTTTTTKKPDFVGTSALGLPLQCGLKNAENPDQERIVGGTNASPNEFPWITVLFKSGKQFCGGSLITKVC